jgi:cytochrome P450
MRFWPDPDRFDPTRFADDPSWGLSGPRNYAYVPFGAGPHVCIGNHFAMAEATIALALLYQRGRLVVERPERVRAKVSATLQVAGGLPVRFEPR